MNHSPDILVLFDIDGTLLDTHGAGRSAFCRGLQRVTGVEDDLPYVSFAGNTDRRVLDEVAAHRGIAFTDSQRKTVFDAIAEELAVALAEAPGAAVPGAAELLAKLSRHGARLGLVTGNIERGAHLKLASAGLDGFFTFGGYGDDEADRSRILRTALAAAGPAPARIILVGDTPLDIEAGLAVGIPVLGVAAGRWDVPALLAAGATHAAPDFTDLPRWLEWIYQPT
jgi:phosphoglycolate phosphatase-like HAD superfamily hydrolase